MNVQERITSPVGDLFILANDAAVLRIDFDDGHGAGARRGKNAMIDQARDELEAYFAGELKAFTFPRAPIGSAFELAVWAELSKLHYAETASYQAIADRLGKPNGCRAVGNANGKNPHAIVVPCHRVIGKNNSLRGYGGGVDRKRWLIAHEARVALRS